MAVSFFLIIGIIVLGISIYVAHKYKFLKFQLILIALLLLPWFGIMQLQKYLATVIIFEEVGLVQALLLQVMDKIYINFVAPVTALLVSIFKKSK